VSTATPFVLIFTPAQLAAAREWIGSCSWREMFDQSENDDLTPLEIERGIERHYCGGRRQFIVDGPPDESPKPQNTATAHVA